MAITRRRLLAGSGAFVAAGIASLARIGASVFAAPRAQSAGAALSQAGGFQSRPDLNGIPALSVLSANGTPGPGYLLLTPWVSNGDAGVGIFDNAGDLVFYHPVTADQATNLQVIEYQGTPMLAWWEGSSVGTYGQGVAYIYSSAYKLVATIGNQSDPIDLHDLLVMPSGTAFAASYVPVPYDLTPIGGQPGSLVLDW